MRISPRLPSSDDAPLAIALGLPCSAVLGLFLWVHLDLGRPLSWASALLVLTATLVVYGVDRWRDRPVRGPSWRYWGIWLLFLQLALLCYWWVQAEQGRIFSLLFFCGGQLLALGHAGLGQQRRGLKHLPGAKAGVVALAVSLACVGMVDAFGRRPDPIAFWRQGEVLSASAFLLALTGCNAQLFDVRDLDRDARAKVPSAAVLLGQPRAKLLAGAWLLGFAGLSVVLAQDLDLAGWASRGVGVCVGLLQIGCVPFRRGASAYFWVLDGALVLPLAVAWLIQVLSKGPA